MPKESGPSEAKPWHVSPQATLAEMAGDFAYASGLLRGTLPLDDSPSHAAIQKVHERAKLIELCGRLARIGEQAGVDTTALWRLRAELPKRVKRHDSPEQIVFSDIAEALWAEADVVVARIQQRTGAGNDKSYRAAKEVCALFGFDPKSLRKFLDAHPEVSTRRPKTRDGRDNPQRLEVHIGELAEAKARDAAGIDPLDLPAETVDLAVAEVQRRKAEIDTRRNSPRK